MSSEISDKEQKPPQEEIDFNNQDQPKEKIEGQEEDQKEEEKPAEEKPVAPAPEEVKHTAGRKPTVMGKKNGKTVYFDDDTQNKFRSIKYLQNIDATSVIYTAVVQFLEKYCEDGKLNEKGREQVQETCKL